MNAQQPELDLDIEFPVTEAPVLEDLVRDLVEAAEKDEFTPYLVSVVTNLALEAMGTDYRVRPQMMYNYDRQGMIVRGRKDSKRFTPEEVTAFVVRFVERNKNK